MTGGGRLAGPVEPRRSAVGPDAVAAGGGRQAGVPYLVVAGDAFDPGDAGWLADALPQATVEVVPGRHFPHLADPRAFAEWLALTGRWP